MKDQEHLDLDYIHRPPFNFKYGDNPFEKIEYGKVTKENPKISQRMELKSPTYKLGANFFKKMNSERFDYKHKYHNYGPIQGNIINEHFGQNLVDERQEANEKLMNKTLWKRKNS